MTLEEQLKELQLAQARTQAYIDCCNVIGKYVCYHAADEQEKIASLFATKTEGCRIEMMSGVFEGDDGIEAFFHSHPNADDDANRKGFLHIHMLTTPIVEVAADGESVMGSWYSPGVESNTFGGTLNGFWAWMKYGAIFKKEDGQWKIWHYFAGTDFALRPGFAYASLKTEETTPCDKYLEQEFGEPTEKFEAYTSFYNYFPYPELTMEHATFADTISNGPEGNPNYKKA